MGSGIIYAGIIAIWAAYFIPRWLKRHDELSESRSVERFDHAMRILSRREATPDKRYVVMPPRPAAPPRTMPARAMSSRAMSARAAPAGARPTVRRVSPAAMRRRRILAAVLVLTLVVAVLTPLTALPWWVPVLLLVVTVADVAHLRVQVLGSRQVDRSRKAVRRSVRSRLLRIDAVDRLVTVRREIAEDRAAEDARWSAAEEADRQVREAEERQAAEAAAGWSPVPVPLPTYVSKPMAPRRSVSTARATDGQPFDQQPFDQHLDTRAVPATMSALVDDADVAEDQIDAILTQRAVND